MTNNLHAQARSQPTVPGVNHISGTANPAHPFWGQPLSSPSVDSLFLLCPHFSYPSFLSAPTSGHQVQLRGLESLSRKSILLYSEVNKRVW